MRTQVSFVCPEPNPRVAAPLCVREDSVQDTSADPLAPSLGDDVQIAEETAAGDDRTRAVGIAHRPGGCHPNHYRTLFGHEKPRVRFAHRFPAACNARQAVWPHAAAASEIRPLEEGDRCVEISRVPWPEQNRQLERLDAALRGRFAMTPGIESLDFSFPPKPAWPISLTAMSLWNVADYTRWRTGGDDPVLEEFARRHTLGGARVLDLGCGPGHAAAALAEPHGAVVTRL